VAEAKVREALDEGLRRLQQGNPYDPVLITMVQQAQAQVDAGALGPDLEGRVRQLRRDLDMLRHLEEARLQTAAGGKDAAVDYAGADRLYMEAFHSYGLEPPFPRLDGGAEQVRTSAIRTHLVVALDNWAFVRNQLQKESGVALAELAERADEDPWRQRLRRAVACGDRIALEGLAKEPAVLRQPPASVILLAVYLGPVDREELLRAAQLHHPADLFINFQLGLTLLTKEPPDPGQAIGFYRAALWKNTGNRGQRGSSGKTRETRGSVDLSYSLLSILGSAQARPLGLVPAQIANLPPAWSQAATSGQAFAFFTRLLRLLKLVHCTRSSSWPARTWACKSGRSLRRRRSAWSRRLPVGLTLTWLTSA
jgi:hypothetical protein